MKFSALMALSLLPSCNAISGINDYETAEQVTTAALAPDAAVPDALSSDTAEARWDAGQEEGAPDASPDATPETAPPDTGTLEAPCPTHSNGLGGTYVFCAPLGTPGVESTYSIAMAKAAWLTVPAVERSGPMPCGADAGTYSGTAMYADTPTDASAGPAVIWGVTGSISGHVRKLTEWKTGTAEEACPTVADPTWN